MGVPARNHAHGFVPYLIQPSSIVAEGRSKIFSTDRQLFLVLVGYFKFPQTCL